MPLDAEVRRVVLAGRVVTLAATDATRRLCDGVAERAAGAPDLDAFQGIVAFRRALAASAAVQALVDAALVSLGCDPEHIRVDALRFRAIASGGHRVPAAAAAYAAHRDTWFGNPRAQLNLWMPLDDVTADSTFAIYPAYFTRAVRNSSGRFDADALAAAGGFGAGVAASEHHPTVVGDFDRSSELRVVCERAQVVVFAAAHLHETLPQDTGRTRRSVDLRIVDDRDAPVPDVDDACRGSTLASYRAVEP
jgi:hypothetical protein